MVRMFTLEKKNTEDTKLQTSNVTNTDVTDEFVNIETETHEKNSGVDTIEVATWFDVNIDIETIKKVTLEDLWNKANNAWKNIGTNTRSAINMVVQDYNNSNVDKICIADLDI